MSDEYAALDRHLEIAREYRPLQHQFRFSVRQFGRVIGPRVKLMAPEIGADDPEGAPLAEALLNLAELDLEELMTCARSWLQQSDEYSKSEIAQGTKCIEFTQWACPEYELPPEEKLEVPSAAGEWLRAALAITHAKERLWVLLDRNNLEEALYYFFWGLVVPPVGERCAEEVVERYRVRLEQRYTMMVEFLATIRGAVRTYWSRVRAMEALKVRMAHEEGETLEGVLDEVMDRF